MSIILMILLLSILILVHEAGHFFAARALGIKVTKFGFGLPIGPTLWSKQVGDVEVLVHAFLLGGYVSFPDDEKDSGVVISEEDRFMSKPVWKRMIVISAGVIANIITAFVFVIFTASVWGHLPSGDYQVYVGKILKENDYSAQYSNLQENDEITMINGINISSPYALSIFAKNSVAFDGKISEDDYNDTLITLKSLNPTLDENEVIESGVIVKLPNRQDESPLFIDENVLKGYKFFKDFRIELTQTQKDLRDNLLEKSTYVSEGKYTLSDVAYAITDNKTPINVEVLRDGKVVKISTIYPNKDGLIGVVPNPKEILMNTNTLLTVITGSCKYLWTQTYVLVYGLWQLFTGQIPIKDLHGIVAITKIGGDVIQNNGFFSGLLLTAIISLNLALVNFLPIPALDGGHFMFLLIEKLRGKPLDEDAINKISSICFMLLLVFMILIVFNDVYALIIHKF